MPMDRALYPANWEAIAAAIKDAAGWHCQGCGRPCHCRYDLRQMKVKSSSNGKG